MVFTSGRMATAQTAKEWPVRVRLHFLLTQTLAVQSQDPDSSVPNLTYVSSKHIKTTIRFKLTFQHEDW